MAVSTDMLNTMTRQDGRTPKYRTAPLDLMVIGLARVTVGGWWELVVWSSEFSPCPNDGERPMHPLPLVEFWSSD